MPGKILIVDDIATNRIVLKVKLSAAYYDVLQASSGAEAVQLATSQRPDLVLISDRLPDSSGSDLCLALRKLPECPGMPVVILTTQTGQAARLAALAAGADDVLAKPLDDLLLLARLRSLLRARATTEELRLRDGTNRALGFAEEASSFDSAAQVLLVTPAVGDAIKWKQALEGRMPHSVSTTSLKDAMPRLAGQKVPDAVVMSLDKATFDAGLRVLADIRARPESRLTPVLVVLNDAGRQAASDALDLGANDLMPDGFEPGEVILRLRTLIQRKRLADRLRDNMRDGLMAAVIDPLTGLYNRRYAMPHLARMAENARKTQRNFAVMVADLDHFKAVNDHYGHAAGDAVLVSVSRQIRENLRAIDLAARIGGEEFLIALPETDKSQAAVAAKRLCDIIGQTPVKLPGRDEPIYVTISIGVAVSTSYGQESSPEANEMIDHADRALYAAKSHGRNCVTLAERPAA